MLLIEMEMTLIDLAFLRHAHYFSSHITRPISNAYET